MLRKSDAIIIVVAKYVDPFNKDVTSMPRKPPKEDWSKGSLPDKKIRFR